MEYGLVNLPTPARAVTAEVQQRETDDESKMSWAVELKQLCENLKKEAKDDMEKLDKHDMEATSPTRASSRDRTSKKKKDKGKRKEKSKKESSSDSSCPHPRGPLRIEPPKEKTRKDWLG